MDLIAQIDSWAAVAPERLAHKSADRTLTYGELKAHSDSLAAFLSLNLPPDRSPFAVVGHKEPEMLVAFLGAVKAGHPYIPIDSFTPPRRVKMMTEAADASTTLTAERVNDLAGTPTGPQLPKLRSSDPYYVIFTSGSTGEPKGVVITLECLSSFVEWMLAEQQFGDGEVFLNQAPFSFDLSVMDLYLSLATGGTLYSVTADQIANPKQLFRALSDSNVTCWVSTPSFAQFCLAEKAFDAAMMPGVRRFMFCGETLPPEVARQLLERFPLAEVWNTYGPTEATCCTTSIRVDATILSKYSRLPVGYPKPGTQIAILEPDGRDVQQGGTGEIIIAGPNVSTGYLAREDLNARSFFTYHDMRAYRTGDLGHFQAGMLFFEGRKDTQIKLHGYRIELGDVESNLRGLPGISDAIVLAVVKEGRPDSLAAFIVLSEPNPDSDFGMRVELSRRLSERLPNYMIPRKFIVLAAFPMTPNGKVDRERLQALIQEQLT